MRTSGLLPSRLLVSALLGTVPAAEATEPARLRLGDPGRCGERPSLVIAVFDDSGSVSSPAGADPISNRYAEAREAFRVVGRACRCRQCLGAVLHFDLVGGVPPSPLHRRVSGAVEAGLRVPPMAAGSSVLAPSLEEAFRLAPQHPQHLLSLLVLSDFLLMDADPAAVLSRLGSFPGDVHAVVLGGRAPDSLMDGRIQITPVSPGDPPGTVASAVFASLTRHRLARRTGGADPGAG
jgi:hypothetical protein